MSRLTCPVCERCFDEQDSTAAMPFCSSRCKQIDAVRWLGEKYGLPIENDEDPDSVYPSSDSTE